MKIRLYGEAADSIVDGPGLRYAVFFQGCPRSCEGCHNPDSQPFEGGYEREIADIVASASSSPLTKGITISGGEPLSQPQAAFELACEAHKAGLDVWLYTGYRYEDVVRGNDEKMIEALAGADVVVDGPFILASRDSELCWRGSANQRIIDIARSKDAAGGLICPPYVIPDGK